MWCRLLLFAVLLLHPAYCAVKFRKKQIINGITFFKEQKFSNSSAPSEVGRLEEYNGLNVLMVADYQLYSGFTEISRGDEVTAQHYANEYLSAIFDQIKSIYSGVKLKGKPLDMKLSGTFVSIRPIDCPLLQPDDMLPDDLERNGTVAELLEDNNSTSMSIEIKATHGLNKFIAWLKKYEDLLPLHDHAMLITKMDLVSPQGYSSTQGMAYVAAACQKGDSSSIIEDMGAMATAQIAAHELGHNLGSYHDGSTESPECPNKMNYLMASAVSGSLDDDRFYNTRKMSKCSVKQIEQYMNTPQARCLFKHGRRSKKSDELTTIQPGERFSATQQCQIAFGPHYALCPNAEYTERFADPCRRIWCKNRQLKRSAPCETMTFFPAFDGTTCGLNRWCINGSCVTNPKKMLDCKDVNMDVCRKYSKVKLRHYCKNKDFQTICCQTCHKAMMKFMQLERRV